MPNGYHGSREEWDRLEAPLCRVDAELRAFAERNGLTLTKNDHGWPERSLTWVDGVERKLQVLLADESARTYNVWAVAWEDRPDGRFWKRAAIANGLTEAELCERLGALLAAGHAALAAWKLADLERAGGS